MSEGAVTVEVEQVAVQTPGGVMPTTLARPTGAGPYPIVVVIMEAFGLVPNIERVAERIAGQGYVAVAPDFYFRQLPNNKFDYDNLDGAIACMQELGDDAFLADMNALLDTLQARPDTTDRVGVTGFCMGGRLSFLSACALPDRVDCAAPFYGGGLTAHLPQAEAIRCPMHLFFGERDPYIPLEQVREVDERLRALGKDYALECYDGADHGFFCDERESYDEAAAVDSWQKLMALFERTLRS